MVRCAASRSVFPAAAIGGIVTTMSMAQAPAPAPGAAPDEAAFRALYRQLIEINTTRSVGSCTAMFHDAEGPRAHGLNERIRVKSLMDGRRFLYEVVKLYANGAD